MTIIKKFQYKLKSTLTFPSIVESVELADSSFEKLTNPNPLHLPDSLLVITFVLKHAHKYKYARTKNRTRQSFFNPGMKSHQPHAYVYSSFVNMKPRNFSLNTPTQKNNYSYLALRYKCYACCDFKKSIHR